MYSVPKQDQSNQHLVCHNQMHWSQAFESHPEMLERKSFSTSATSDKGHVIPCGNLTSLNGDAIVCQPSLDKPLRGAWGLLEVTKKLKPISSVGTWVGFIFFKGGMTSSWVRISQQDLSVVYVEVSWVGHIHIFTSFPYFPVSSVKYNDIKWPDWNSWTITPLQVCTSEKTELFNSFSVNIMVCVRASVREPTILRTGVYIGCSQKILSVSCLWPLIV